MYGIFTLSSNLAIWQDRYCQGAFATCTRFQASARGELVSPALLPNGTLLTRIRKR